MAVHEAVLLRGWAASSDGPAVAREIVGENAEVVRVEAAGGGWRNVDPISPDEPVGAPHSVVTFVAQGPATVDLILGSQGVGAPQDDAGAGLVTVKVKPGQDLVLDARCWFRMADAATDVRLFRRAPSAS